MAKENQEKALDKKALKKDKKKKDKKEKKDRKEKKEKKRAKEIVEEEVNSQLDEQMSQEAAQEEVKTTEEKAKVSKSIKKSEPSKPDWQPKQLFVSGIPYDTTKDQLIDFFGADARTCISEVKMPTFQDSGRCIGYAHVTFTTKASYEAALSKKGQNLGSRYLDIQES